MRCAVLLLALVAGLCAADEIEVDDNVLVLTNSNFQKAIESHDNLLVEFCECPPCRVARITSHVAFLID